MEPTKGMNRSKQLSRLLPRDDYLCGIHLDGCGQPIRNRADATVDHIFTRSFFNEREDGIKPKDYNRDWNCQPMHHECNNRRGGQIYGFPLFDCSCHWLQIDATTNGHRLILRYDAGEPQFTVPVSTEGHLFVFENIIGLPNAEIGSVWSMGSVKPGKKAITGEGHMGHAFPRISPDEVSVFNLLEMNRISGNAMETIEKFNRRMDPMRIQIHWEAAS